eukprot:symbB.v1.2.021444.t1/scaffold1846.1/size151991/5
MDIWPDGIVRHLCIPVLVLSQRCAEDGSVWHQRRGFGSGSTSCLGDDGHRVCFPLDGLSDERMDGDSSEVHLLVM